MTAEIPQDQNPPVNGLPEIPTEPVKKRRGRPPGSKNKGPTKRKTKAPLPETMTEFPAKQLYDAALRTHVRKGLKNRKMRNTAAGGEVTPSLTEARDHAIYCEWIQGKTQRQIAEEVGLSQTGVSQICSRIGKELAPMFAEHVKNIREEHTDRLMYMISEAMGAWHRSKEVAISVTDSTGEKAGTSTTIKGQVGDIGILSEARAALGDVRKIWGADKPPATGPEGASEEGWRAAGKPMTQVVQERIDQLQRRLSQMTHPEPSAN